MEKKPTNTKVLIVEDELLIAAEIEMSLRDLGYHPVGKARDGVRALDLVATCKPDIVLLDINLRGTMTGIEIAKVISEKHNCPFVFLTALSDAATLDQAKATMPYGYIVKPFNDNDLRTNIELALYRFAQQQNVSALPNLAQVNDRLVEPLSTREYEVLELLEEGLTYRQIGERLFIGYNTVKTYQKSLFAKLSVSSRYEMSQWLRQ